LVAVIGVARLARIAYTRPGLALLLAGALLVVAGNLLPSGVAFIAGMMISLRGAAVLLGVSEPRHRSGGQPARAADFFGFGTPSRGQGYPGQG
jgi:membrane-bound ClpP family serine protease